MNKTKKLVFTALIAAAYAVLTLVIAPFSFGAVQLRISEALTILPVFTPYAIPGLALGCLIANIFSPFGLIDMVFGTIATIIAAFLSYKVRNIKFKGFPILAPLFPIISNGIIIGAVTAFMANLNFSGFLINAGLIALGEGVSCYLLGIPFYFAFKALIKKSKINIF